MKGVLDFLAACPEYGDYAHYAQGTWHMAPVAARHLVRWKRATGRLTPDEAARLLHALTEQ